MSVPAFAFTWLLVQIYLNKMGENKRSCLLQTKHRGALNSLGVKGKLYTVLFAQKYLHQWFSPHYTATCAYRDRIKHRSKVVDLNSIQATLTIFFGPQFLRRAQDVPDKKKKTSIQVFFFIFPCCQFFFFFFLKQNHRNTLLHDNRRGILRKNQSRPAEHVFKDLCCQSFFWYDNDHSIYCTK